MSTRDLAALVARNIIEDVADEIRQDPTLRRRVTNRLRDELAIIQDKLLAEIRLSETDTPGCPATQTTPPTNTGER
jgi:hypothetical protein